MNQTTTVFFRKCDVCGGGMNEGYYDGDNLTGDYSKEYFCSDKCLNTLISSSEWSKAYSDDGDSYYTEWVEAGDDDDWVYTTEGVEVGQK